MSTPDSEAAINRLTLVQGLFVQHSPALRGFILALMPDFSRVDDVLQETFLTVTKKAADFEPGSNFLNWACAIAKFKMLETVRREPRRTQTLSAEVIESLCACHPTEEQTELRLALLAECMEKLAPQTRQAIELRYQQAHKPAEIAQQLGWSAESVYVALSRGRGLLRDCVSRKLEQAGEA